MIALLGAGAPLPDITLEGPDGPVSLRKMGRGRPLVVAFYQEDATPTCTTQLSAFRDDFDLIEELGAVLVAISADSVESHRVFAEAHPLPFPLLADAKLEAARAFGVVDESGRRSVRAVFVADDEGTVVASIPYYNPANGQHYQAVFQALGVDLGGATLR